jgi:hypothetical protein
MALALLQKEHSKKGAPRRTVNDAYKKSSSCRSTAEIGFGTGARPSLVDGPSGGPGPGSYPAKSTLGVVPESTLPNPLKFSLRGRTKFGDPNEKTMNKHASAEPGPGAYDLQGKFVSGSTSRVTAFTKGDMPKDKAALGPGPGSYECAQAMGKQALSTKVGMPVPAFPKEPRPGLAFKGASDVGPGDYGAGPAACERQALSQRGSCAMVKFGTGYRRGNNAIQKQDLSEPTPGPGAYTLPKFKTPAATMSGRNKFGSPW